MEIIEVESGDIEIVEIAEQGPSGPPGNAENIAEISPSPVLSFENALI